MHKFVNRNMLNIKVKGSTIMEVLISLVIISFCAALASVIYLNIQKSSTPFFKIKAVELAEFYMRDALSKGSYIEESFTAEEFSVKKVIAVSPDFNDCYNLRIIVFDLNKKKIFELESTVYKGN